MTQFFVAITVNYFGPRSQMLFYKMLPLLQFYKFATQIFRKKFRKITKIIALFGGILIQKHSFDFRFCWELKKKKNFFWRNLLSFCSASIYNSSKMYFPCARNRLFNIRGPCRSSCVWRRHRSNDILHNRIKIVARRSTETITQRAALGEEGWRIERHNLGKSAQFDRFGWYGLSKWIVCGCIAIVQQ